MQTFLQTYEKPNWIEVWIKIKIYCLLWTDFTKCPIVFIVDFEQVSAGLESKGGKTKQVRSTKIYFDIFIETMFAFLLHLPYWKFHTEKLLFRKKQIGFDVWMATILRYIKPSFTARWHFPWFANDF